MCRALTADAVAVNLNGNIIGKWVNKLAKYKSAVVDKISDFVSEYTAATLLRKDLLMKRAGF